MAYLDPEDEAQRGLRDASGPAPMSAGPAPMSGTPAAPGGAAPLRPAGRGTGYVNLESYMRANQGAGQGMANAIAGDVTAAGQKAQDEANAWRAQAAHSTAATAEGVNPNLLGQATRDAFDAQAQARAAGTAPGVGALLSDHYGKQGGYGSGMRGFDTFLTRSEGNGALEGLGSKYGALGSYVTGLGAGYAPQVVSPVSPGSGKGGASTMSPKGISFAPPEPASGPRSGVGGGGSDFDERKKRRML